MGRNAGRQYPLYLVLRLCYPVIQVSHQEDVCSRGSARYCLLYSSRHQLVIGQYVHPYYIPPLPPHRQHKIYHVWAVIHHSLKLPPLLPLLHYGDDDLVLAPRLRLPYGVAGDLPHVDTLCQIFS